TYNHNSSLKVSVGQKVKRGQVVSLSGTTGNSTGCHVHLEVLVDGTPVDPAGWL
ncbi:MAG: M23 family metallopeptidase, partial [Micrococcaceae bacterium]|nr:M23 family metallopeptidase [Micrococcaceae bacterium]